ncbi:MAG: glutathione S-transferase N-terminal domain-containing protein [Pseudomonadales bacterium]
MPPGTGMTLRLHQFAASHFNEKVRWALDFKGLAHERVSYLPGPHIPAIRRLSGQTQTPVLELDGRVISGSANIIDVLEERQPDPALYPGDAGLRGAALDLQGRFDETVGPAVRTVVFSELINDGAYLCRMFAGSKSWPKRLAYRAAFPLARGLIAKGNGVDRAENVTRCFAETALALDRVAEQVQNSGYLIGTGFSVADLTAAALLAPIADLAHPDMARPRPVPDAYAELVGQYRDHPAIAWVKRIYDLHR